MKINNSKHLSGQPLSGDFTEYIDCWPGKTEKSGKLFHFDEDDENVLNVNR